jgi:hypothetical protein
MDINKNLNLILRDIYLYDIEECHYTILKKLNIDVSHIPREDKTQRNIEIGKMMRENPKLSEILVKTTNSVIDDYIEKNELKENEIVIRQYDGIIVTRKLPITEILIPLPLRKYYQLFIASINRRMYIAIDSAMNVVVKGVPHKYDAMTEIYKQLLNAVFIGKKVPMFKKLQKIKDEFLYSEDAWLFSIPMPNDKYKVYLKQYGEIEITESTVTLMDTDDIDKIRYFQKYIQPFTKSIVFENVR